MRKLLPHEVISVDLNVADHRVDPLHQEANCQPLSFSPDLSKVGLLGKLPPFPWTVFDKRKFCLHLAKLYVHFQ